MADDTKPATPKAADKPVASELKTTNSPDTAANDGRARGDELEMSDRYAPSHLAAQNQVPQEGKPVQNPPQPEPPKDSNRENQDTTGPDGMSVTPKNRLVGQGIPAEDADAV